MESSQIDCDKDLRVLQECPQWKLQGTSKRSRSYRTRRLISLRSLEETSLRCQMTIPLPSRRCWNICMSRITASSRTLHGSPRSYCNISKSTSSDKSMLSRGYRILPIDGSSNTGSLHGALAQSSMMWPGESTTPR